MNGRINPWLAALTILLSFTMLTGFDERNPIGFLILATIVGSFAFVIVVLICREIVCWYWKINLHLAKQDQIIGLLKAIKTQLAAANQSVASADAATTQETLAAANQSVASADATTTQETGSALGFCPCGAKIQEKRIDCPRCGAKYR
ncbi:MAG: hypothetical protein C4523_09440 [Myxococcales bacterium]|nr:MAG: hypothetical protein C4523_09440 [Myxococcales bacterium]